MGKLFAGAIFLFIPAFVFAQVVISEVQLYPIEERFVELHNMGDFEVDLTGWYIQRKTATGDEFNSAITSTDTEGKSIGAGEYFLISRENIPESDIAKEDLTLTDDNTIRMRNSNREDVDEISWESVPEGSSYQKVSGSWVVAAPTPGEENSTSGGGNDGGDSGSVESTSPPEPTTSADTGEERAAIADAGASQEKATPRLEKTADLAKKAQTAEPETTEINTLVNPTGTQTALVVGTQGGSSDSSPLFTWLLAVGALTLLVIGGVVFITMTERKAGKGPAEEYDIIEE